MRYTIQPDRDFFKPSPWRAPPFNGSSENCLQSAATTARYLVIERTKAKADAVKGDNVALFATSNDAIKRQGKGFHNNRLKSGQIQDLYGLEFAVDCMQVYVAKKLDKVRNS